MPIPTGPSILASPATVSRLVGLFVPIPTLPVTSASPATVSWLAGLAVPIPTPLDALIRNWSAAVDSKSPALESAETKLPSWSALACWPAARRPSCSKRRASVLFQGLVVSGPEEVGTRNRFHIAGEAPKDWMLWTGISLVALGSHDFTQGGLICTASPHLPHEW